jgi:hypothetical protein
MMDKHLNGRMTLEELIVRYRPHLADESVGVRRSWEDMFRYTLKHYSKATPLEAFDPDVLAERLSAADLNPPIIAGYVKRWRELLGRAGDL